MAYVERSDEEMIAAFERWLNRHSAPDEPILAVNDKAYSPRQLVEAISNREEWATKVNLDLLRKLAKEYDEDPVEMIDQSGGDSQCDQCD